MNKMLNAIIESLHKSCRDELNQAEQALKDNNTPGWEVHTLSAKFAMITADALRAARDSL